jgi:hypothetical protein
MNWDGQSSGHYQIPLKLAGGLRMEKKLTGACGYEATQACSKAITSLAFVCMAVTTS